MQNPDSNPGVRTVTTEIVLFVLGGLVILFSSKIPTDWDSCQFVLGMNRFSPPDHHPHPPGYFFFLQVAHLINSVIDNPHRSLVLTSGLAAALIPPAIHRLILKLFPSRPDLALGAGYLALAAPARLFFGAQALAYTWEGLLATLLFSQALNLDPKNEKKSAAPWILWVVLWGITGGFRPNLMVLFLPLGIVLSLRRKLWENILAILIVAIISALWLIPTITASGGMLKYLQALSGHGAYFLGGGFSLDRAWENTVELYRTWAAVTGAGFLFWIVISFFAIIWRRIPWTARQQINDYPQSIFGWIYIPFVILHLVFFYNYRYSLPYMPIFVILSIQAIELLTEQRNEQKPGFSRQLCWILPALICVVSWSFFLTSNRANSLAHIRGLENELNHVSAFVRELGENENVTIVAGRQFRPWGTALPEYTTLHPMHSLYPSELNPRIAVMENGDTTVGNFYMPGATESETFSIPPSYVVLDEDAYRVLEKDNSEWQSERITSVENLYWREFPNGAVLEDIPEELVIRSE